MRLTDQERLTVQTMHEVLGTGSSWPSLITTNDNRTAVLKLQGAGMGPKALLAEYMVNWFCGAMDLPVPGSEPVYLVEDHPWEIGTDEFDQAVQFSFGWNLAIEYVPDSSLLTAIELDGLPGRFIQEIVFIDRLFQNYDRSRENTNILRDSTGKFWAIDHGSCLFIERAVDEQAQVTSELPRNHFLRDQPVDIQNIVERAGLLLQSGVIQEVCSSAPVDWVKEYEVEPDRLAEMIRGYVVRFLE